MQTISRPKNKCSTLRNLSIRSYWVYLVYFGVCVFPYNWCAGAWYHIGSEVAATVQGNVYGNKMTFNVTPDKSFNHFDKARKIQHGFSCVNGMTSIEQAEFQGLFTNIRADNCSSAGIL